MMDNEFNSLMTYNRFDIAWYGELKYIAQDFVLGDEPDNSKLWRVYVKENGKPMMDKMISFEERFGDLTHLLKH